MAELEPEDLEVWKLAMELVTELYRETRSWPSDEKYGLISQVRRAAVSVPTNIAEGHHRGSTAEFIHYLRVARGSLAELRTLLRVASNVEYLRQEASEEFRATITRCLKMTGGLIAALERRKSGSKK